MAICTIIGEPPSLRAVLIDPWARTVGTVEVLARILSCGCFDADGRALVELLGRHQRAYVVLDGEAA